MTTTARGNRLKATQDGTRRAALVVRVSTDRQASNPEGSLTTQLQRLRSHVDYKNTAGEDWREAGVYELRGVSGKDSMRSEEYAELFAAIRAGRINTIICTALERLCRSVKDFLWFFEFINEHGVEFVCLKQQYDTTTPQGKLFVTIMIALAEFEREQTAERTRDSTLARAQRGLWNGGQLIGYNLDPERKGYLLPNEQEVALVNYAFDTYLVTGSIKATRDALNGHGYRTKAYKSRRGAVHAGSEFNFTSVQFLLKNPAYIARKLIKSGSEETVVPAVWPPIVDQAKFDEVQRLLGQNARTRHNGAASIRHTYVLSAGLLHCGLCSGPMEGRSGTGRLGVTYFYYVCRTEGCGLRITAGEVEEAVLDRLALLSRDGVILKAVTAETNARLQKQAPALQKRKQSLERSLTAVKDEAEAILANWAGLEGQAGRSFLTEKLNTLALKRADLEHGLLEVEQSLTSMKNDGVDADIVRDALSRFSEVYEHLKPYERKELFRLVLRRAEVHPRRIVLEINANVPNITVGTSEKSDLRSGIPNWLPGLISQSVLRYAFDASLASLSRWARRTRRAYKPLDFATEWSKQLSDGDVANRAALARREGLSRARVTQLLGPA